uniref:Uncharacterized protein n=1 Tax=uncultured prokaryote TaxID=198431 RepID=A0A0H5Q4D3_9ZZZZ|nr:hypothetical protein [uncultured prokaryote]
MRHAELLATEVRPTGIRVMVRMRSGGVPQDRIVWVRWNDLDLSALGDVLDREARRALLAAWSDEPLPGLYEP